MSDYTPEVQAEIDRVSANIQKALNEFLQRKADAFERVPTTEAGMAEIVAIVSAQLPPVGDYVITVEPQTVEDRIARRSARITIRSTERITMTVEVEK